jgi:uncharacterized protein (DUF488 family)
VCAPGYAKSVRHVAGKVKARVYRAYGVADHDGYIIDHSRGRQPHVPSATNAFWQNQSFHNYADYAMGEDFHAALEKLRKLGHSERCAIMCAETLWWRCHRRIISDYLIAASEVVFHILGPDHIARAFITTAAKLGPDRVLTYP